MDAIIFLFFIFIISIIICIENILWFLTEWKYFKIIVLKIVRIYSFFNKYKFYFVEILTIYVDIPIKLLFLIIFKAYSSSRKINN